MYFKSSLTKRWASAAKTIPLGIAFGGAGDRRFWLAGTAWEGNATCKVEFIPFLCLIMLPERSLVKFKGFLQASQHCWDGFRCRQLQGSARVTPQHPFPADFPPVSHLQGIPEAFWFARAPGVAPTQAAALCSTRVSLLGTTSRAKTT